jgi:hypothetical protein
MMNPELMRMLEEAGFIFTPDVMNKLPAFEKLVQLEREACANMADECVDIEKLGEAIRARGQE